MHVTRLPLTTKPSVGRTMNQIVEIAQSLVTYAKLQFEQQTKLV